MKTGILKRNRLVIILTFLLITCIISIFVNNIIIAYANGYTPAEIKYDANDNSSVFPDSYKQYIRNLKATHPNWIFKAVYLNLDWTSSVNIETEGTKSRIGDSAYSNNWKRLTESQSPDYNASGYVLASKKAVAYTMDPRNFLTNDLVFQFRSINENVNSDLLSSVEKSLSNTIMERDEYKSKYFNGSSWIDMGITYSQIIKNVGDSQNVSPLFIASRIKQETSGNIITNPSINGKSTSYPGYFNYFNIGAYDSSSGTVSRGLALAYSKGWNTPQSAISGGIDNINRNYIKVGQNTVYFQKFDVNNTKEATALYSYQYMTNITAPINESIFTYSGLLNSNTLNNQFTFYIPVYENMPNEISSHPDTETQKALGTDYVYLDDPTDGLPDSFKIRSSPEKEDQLGNELNNVIEVVTENESNIENKKKYLRIEVGTNGWDKIRLNDGREGYVYQSYVKTYDYTHVTSIGLDKTSSTLKVGATLNLNTTILPTNAYIKAVSWTSTNSNIASVDTNGKITANAVGNATIIATTLDGNKTASCVITVGNTVATSISVKDSEYPAVVGNYLEVSPTILPSTTTDKSYNIIIEDQTVAKVENGKIKGIKEGLTKVTLTTKDGSNLSCSFNLKVSDSVVTIKELNSDSDNMVTNVSLGSTVSNIKSKIETKYTKKIFDKNNTELSDNDKVGTGSKIKIYNGSSLIEEYTIVIYGDITGDGLINSADLLNIRQHMLGMENLQGCYFKAGNVSKTDNLINSLDLLKIKQHVLGVSLITQ